MRNSQTKMELRNRNIDLDVEPAQDHDTSETNVAHDHDDLLTGPCSFLQQNVAPEVKANPQPDVTQALQQLFEDCATKGSYWRTFTSSLSLFSSLYVLFLMNNPGSPFTVTWFYMNVLIRAFHLVVFRLGLFRPDLQHILVIGIVMSMFVQLTLILTAPLCLKIGSGDSTPILLMLLALKLSAYFSKSSVVEEDIPRKLNLESFFEEIHNKTTLSGTIISTLSLFTSIYAFFGGFDDLGPSWTVAWFYFNMLYMTYVIFSFRFGLMFPKDQTLFAFVITIAVALEMALIIGAPFVLRIGAGQAQPFVVAILLAKVLAILA